MSTAPEIIACSERRKRDATGFENILNVKCEESVTVLDYCGFRLRVELS